MKRNAKLNSRKLSAMLCLALTLVLVMTALFAVTASAATEESYKLVTSTSELSVGDKIIIAAKDSNFALSTTQNNNNRGHAAITKNSDGTATLTSAVQVLTLAAGKVSGTFAFNTGKGYLYAASSSSNYLKTQTTLSDNSSWNIEIDSNGTATVKAQGTNTRNVMQYNKQSSLFAAYKSASQQAIVIYKLTTVEATCEHTNTTTTTQDATCKEEGFTKVVCDDCEATVSNTPIAALGHNYVDGFCSRCEIEEPVPYELVTDIDNLKVGDKIVIVATGYNYALSTTQNDKNRGQAGVTKGDNVVTFEDDVEIITVEAGNIDGTFAFKVAGGYLYAAGGTSTNNYLKTETTLSNNSSWTITIDAKGIATIKSQGGASRNWLRYNNSSKLFSCYGSGQADIAIYKLPVVEPEVPECEHKAELSGAVVNLGQSLAIKYYVNVCEHDDIANYSMKFTMNENTVTVNDVATDDNGTYFAFTGIAPQCMGDNVAAELLCDGEVVLAKAEYSVLTNLKALLADNATTEAVKTLIYNTLAYGAEAQKYTGYKTDALVNADHEEGATQNAQPADAHVLSALKDGATASFKSAAVEFGDVNKIIVKINAADAANVTLKVGETALTLTKVSDGVYAATTDAISSLNLGAKVGFNLYVGEDLVQTLTYSVNDYASRKWEDAEMGALVKALYNYGVAARLYREIPEKN